MSGNLVRWRSRSFERSFRTYFSGPCPSAAGPAAAVAPQPQIRILFWNGFYDWPLMGMGSGDDGFVSAGCQFQNCFMTSDKAELGTSADAVMVHGTVDNFARTVVASQVLCAPDQPQFTVLLTPPRSLKG